jgi:hypothetical protein
MLIAANTTIDFAEEYKNLAYAAGPFVVFDNPVFLSMIGRAVGSEDGLENYPVDCAVNKARFLAMPFPNGYQQFIETWTSIEHERPVLFLPPVIFTEGNNKGSGPVVAEVRTPQQFSSYLNEIIALSYLVSDKFSGKISDEDSRIIFRSKDRCSHQHVTFDGRLTIRDEEYGIYSQTKLRIKQRHFQLRISLG